MTALLAVSNPLPPQKRKKVKSNVIGWIKVIKTGKGKHLENVCWVFTGPLLLRTGLELFLAIEIYNLEAI